MFILKNGHQPGVYVPLRALFLVSISDGTVFIKISFIRPCCCLELYLKLRVCENIQNLNV